MRSCGPSSILSDTSIYIPLSPNGIRIDINFSLPIQNNMQLGINGTDSDLFRTSSGAIFPYTISDVVSITGTNALAGYYYFFYDWEIVAEPCISNISPVTAIINNSTLGGSTVTTCDSYTWDGVTYTQTGSYTNSYTNGVGCDSTHILDLTINDIYAINNTIDICYGDTLIVGSSIYTSSGIYTDLLSSVSGCDSTITTQLTVSSSVVSIISQTGVDLIVTTIGGAPSYTYQWSTGETTDQITPTINEEYWLIVTDVDGCSSDTSFFTVTWIQTSIEDLRIDKLIIYPNPTEGIVNIKFNDKFKGSIMLENILGELIFNKTRLDIEKNQTIQIDLSLFSKGVYFIRIVNSTKIVNQKLILE
jgi:hypothetical protein